MNPQETLLDWLHAEGFTLPDPHGLEDILTTHTGGLQRKMVYDYLSAQGFNSFDEARHEELKVILKGNVGERALHYRDDDPNPLEGHDSMGEEQT
jgi:hypothetical protein